MNGQPEAHATRPSASRGADCDKAATGTDGGPAEIGDTYSADDIWGVFVYERELAAAGKHTLTVTVLGEEGPRGKVASVCLADGPTRDWHPCDVERIEV